MLNRSGGIEHARWTLLASPLAATLTTHASATLLYSQPLDTSFMGGSGSMARNFERFAEGFTLTSPSSVDQVRWWGMRTGSGAGGPLTGFQVRFYLSDGPNGAPGTILSSQDFTIPDLNAQFTRQLGGSIEYFYTATLAPVSLPANQRIFFHVGGISPDFTTGFAWSRSIISSGYQATDAFDPGWIVYNGQIGHAYELHGTVPAPATVAAFAAPLALTLRRRRSRSQRHQ